MEMFHAVFLENKKVSIKINSFKLSAETGGIQFFNTGIQSKPGLNLPNNTVSFLNPLLHSSMRRIKLLPPAATFICV